MLYNPVKVNVPSRYHALIKKALEKKGKVSVKINLTASEKKDTLLLTRGQISKMERAAPLGEEEHDNSHECQSSTRECKV